MVELRQAEKVEIVTLMDNYTDCLIPSTDHVTRNPHHKDGKVAPPLVAEHGLSLLIRVFENGKSRSLLLDAGWSATGVIHNLNQLEIRADEIETIVLSHGHMDHFGSLRNILELVSDPIPIIAHPDVFLRNRFLVLPDGKRVLLPTLDERSLTEDGDPVITNSRPYPLASNLLLATGEIERTTDFEKGLPNAYIEQSGEVQPDRLLDDQALLVNLKDKGLVVITGCAHSGIINTIRYAQKTTGIEPVYAVIGGFHLSGQTFEPIIPRTLEELKAVNPAIIAPMHCTGWKATTKMAEAFPRQFVLSSVGTTIALGRERNESL